MDSICTGCKTCGPSCDEFEEFGGYHWFIDDVCEFCERTQDQINSGEVEMDPNETLQQIRDLAKADDGELALLVEALDEWLYNGGFLPHDWKTAKKGWSCPQ